MVVSRGGVFHLELDGSDVTGPIQVPNTGGWFRWGAVQTTDIPLPAGNHILRLALDSGPAGGVGVLDSMLFSFQAPLTTTTSTTSTTTTIGTSTTTTVGTTALGTCSRDDSSPC